MASFIIDAPNGKSYTIEGENAQGALAALKTHLETAPASFNERFDEAPKVNANPEARDHGLSERQKLSPVERAISPITSYPATYQRMNQEARDQMSHGIDQIAAHDSLIDPKAHGIADVVTGAGKTALGALSYVASPINAAYRSIVGQPIEDVTGIPREHTEFAAQLLTPGLGLTGKAAAPVVSLKGANPTIPELKAAASGKAGQAGGYQGAELADLAVRPTAISDFATKTKVALDTGGIDENLAPKTHAILSKLEKVPDSPSATVTGNNIMSLRQLLGNAAGEPGKEGLAASRALKALDEHIPSITPRDVISGDPKAAGAALDTANANYSAAKHAETIDNKTIRADLRASATNSGHNVANTVRQRMADILNPERPDLQRGFTQDELAMMERVVRGTKTQNALREVGNYLGGGGGMGRLHVSAIGATIGAILGPAGAAVGASLPTAFGAILKAMGNKSTLKAAADISEAIRSRAPLASAAQKFEVKAGSFGKVANSGTYAGALLAARNFSNNLSDAGINISPGRLMRSLQGPVPARAQDEQQ